MTDTRRGGGCLQEAALEPGCEAGTGKGGRGRPVPGLAVAAGWLFCYARQNQRGGVSSEIIRI